MGEAAEAVTGGAAQRPSPCSTLPLECAVVGTAPDVVCGAVRGPDMLFIHPPLFDVVVRGRGVPDRVRRRTVATPPSTWVSDLSETVASDDQGDLEAGPGLLRGAPRERGRLRGGLEGSEATIERRRVEPGDHAGFEEPGWAEMAAAFVVHPVERGVPCLSTKRVPPGPARFPSSGSAAAGRWSPRASASCRVGRCGRSKRPRKPENEVLRR